MRVTRRMLISLTMLPLLSLLASSARAAAPDFSGNWVLDPAKSEDAKGLTIALAIQDAAGKINFQRTIHERDGHQIQSSFTCAPNGEACDFDENGHKAKVSLWYDGSVLMMAKTGGRAEAATTERKFELSPDGKTLTIEFTNYSTDGKAQKLVFVKQ